MNTDHGAQPGTDSEADHYDQARDGGRIFQDLRAARDAGREKKKIPDCLVRGVEPELKSYPVARLSRHLYIWM